MSSRKKLLFINQYYWPDEAATAQLLDDLARWLVGVGHTVTVLCGSSRYAGQAASLPGTSVRNGVRIERMGGTNWGRCRTGGRLMDAATFMAAARLRLAGLEKHDIVVSMTSPPWVGSLGVWYQARHQVPMLLWMQDIYPDVAERLGALANPVLRRALHGLSGMIYRASARVVVLAEGMARTLRNNRVSRDKLRVIPNWANTEDITACPVRENRFRAEQGWGGEPIIMYAGNAGLAHDIDTMMELLALLQQETPALRFVLVGDSPRHVRIMETARRLNIRRATWLPFQPRSALGELLGAADAHLVAQKPEVEGLLFSSKFYGAVAAGRPVVAVGPAASDLGRSILDANLGAVVENGKAGAGVEAAQKALCMARGADGTVSRIRAWAEGHASHRVRLPQLGQVLEELMDGTAGATW